MVKSGVEPVSVSRLWLMVSLVVPFQRCLNRFDIGKKPLAPFSCELVNVTSVLPSKSPNVPFDASPLIAFNFIVPVELMRGPVLAVSTKGDAISSEATVDFRCGGEGRTLRTVGADITLL